MKSQTNDRYSFEALIPIIEARWRPVDEASLEVSGIIGKAVAVTGYARSAILRWPETGISAKTADAIATSLGYHPSNIWPEWWDVEVLTKRERDNRRKREARIRATRERAGSATRLAS